MGLPGVSLVGVADAGPLLHLAQVDALRLLSTFDDLLVPETVMEEVSVGGPPAGLDELSHEVVTAGDPPGAAAELDPGESAALTVALDRDAVLLTDDMDARTVATEIGVEVHGSVGVVALGHGRDRIDLAAAEAVLRALGSEASLYVTDAVIDRGIERLRELSDQQAQ